jgi:hypothetical protein
VSFWLNLLDKQKVENKKNEKQAGAAGSKNKLPTDSAKEPF